MFGRFTPFLKLLLALAIPAALYGFWYYAQHFADEEVRIYVKEQKEHPTTDFITIDHYELKEIDDANHLRWQLNAQKGTLQPISKDVELVDVLVKYFDGPDVKLQIQAPIGVANEVTKIVHLDSTKDKKVIAEGHGGKAKMIAAKVELTKKNDFIATGGVNIEWPGVAKVTGEQATGSLKNTDLSEFKISGDTHAVLGVQ